MKCVALLFFASLTLSVVHARAYGHKSEAELARMTAAQRVDEWVKENANHGYDTDDDYGDIVRKYVMGDGLAALPRLIEIMDEYDPSRPRGGEEKRWERLDACLVLLDYMDARAVRLRGSAEGMRVLDALERAVKRMGAAGYADKDKAEWEQHERYEWVGMHLKDMRGVGHADRAIMDTFWVNYKIKMSDEELAAFSNYLIARDPTYPSWSEQSFIKDYTRRNEAGNPLQRFVFKKPERFYEAYSDFQKAKK